MILGKRSRAIHLEAVDVVLKQKKLRIAHIDFGQIPMDPCNLFSAQVSKSSVTPISVKLAREAAHEMLPRAP